MKDTDRTTLDESGEGFLSRWSRRKQQASTDLPEAVPPAEQVPAEPEPVLTDADMPPLESLDERSDYSGFLSSGVSEELRRLALRKLFRSAAFNVTDGLDDYAEDFTSFAKLGDIVTREMRVREAIDAAREKAKALLAEAEPGAAEAGAHTAPNNENDPPASVPDMGVTAQEPTEEIHDEQHPQST